MESCTSPNPTKSLRSTAVTATKPDATKRQTLFTKLSECGTKPAFLSLVPGPLSDRYIPAVSKPNFPWPLQDLYDKRNLQLGYLELLSVCENVTVVLTEEMAEAVEQDTRSQSSSTLWFTYRAGRITASRMKSVCSTNVANPAQSLVKVIAYPEAFKFTTKATMWGCKHEKLAREFYCNNAVKSHVNFSVEDVGLMLNPKWPYIGASPDGMVNCDCCGKGVLERKCPYCHKNEGIIEASNDKKFCVSQREDGSYYLDHGHAYYYQVQTQIFVSKVHYCDFVVCTFPDDQ